MTLPSGVLRLSAIQLCFDDAEAADERLAAVQRMVADEAAAGADLIVLPELWLHGFFSFGTYRTHAQPLDGPFAGAMARLAMQQRVNVHAGSFVELADRRFHNTSLLFNAEGRVLAVYRKRHLFAFQSREAELLAPGKSAVCAVVEGFPLGLATCYDLRFPEHFRELTSAGAALQLLVAAWPDPRPRDWSVLLQARAIETQAYVVASNLCGRQAGHTYLGRTSAYGPDGSRIGELGAEAGALRVRLDLSAVQHQREQFPFVTEVIAQPHSATL